MHKLLMTIVAAACLAALPVLTGEARAELEVKRSTADGYPRGAKVKETDILDVPANKEIEFFEPSSGKTYTIKGPYKGKQADYKNPCSFLTTMLGNCEQQKSDGTVPGATRGFKRTE